MPGLGETTDFLTKLRRTTAGRSSPTANRKCVVTADFGVNPGALRMLSYTPERRPDHAPLVVVLHGCTQPGEAFAETGGWLALADRLGFAVLAPEQQAANNPNRCFNWFEPADTRRGQGEVASIAAMIAALVRSENLDAERVYIVGLSAGGAMAAAMLASYPELFAGGAVIAGLPSGAASNLQEALGAMRSGGRNTPALPAAVRPVRLSIWHGSADAVVSPANAQQIVDQWRQAASVGPNVLTRKEARRTHQTWSDGASTIELHLIQGMGHGVPLSTRTPGAVGDAAPFMLETGIPSTLEIADFWDLGAGALFAPSPEVEIEAAPSVGAPGIGAMVMNAVSPHIPQSVQDVIANALRTAGLR